MWKERAFSGDCSKSLFSCGEQGTNNSQKLSEHNLHWGSRVSFNSRPRSKEFRRGLRALRWLHEKQVSHEAKGSSVPHAPPWPWAGGCPVLLQLAPCSLIRVWLRWPTRLSSSSLTDQLRPRTAISACGSHWQGLSCPELWEGITPQASTSPCSLHLTWRPKSACRLQCSPLGDAFVCFVLGLRSFLKLAFLRPVNSDLFEAGDLSSLTLHHAEPDRLETSLKKAALLCPCQTTWTDLLRKAAVPAVLRPDLLTEGFREWHRVWTHVKYFAQNCRKHTSSIEKRGRWRIVHLHLQDPNPLSVRLKTVELQPTTQSW